MNLFSKPYIINTSQKPNSVSSDVCKVRNEFVCIVKLYTQVCPNAHIFFFVACLLPMLFLEGVYMNSNLLTND